MEQQNKADLLPPIILEQAFNPTDLLGGDPIGWCNVLQALSPKLPVHLHCEPTYIKDAQNPDAQPLFRNVVKFLSETPELKEFTTEENEQGEPLRARLKLRLGVAGKFLHRNGASRRQVIMCLSGQQEWLFLSSVGGGADTNLTACTNQNWCGFRSEKYPKMLTVSEMDEIAAQNIPGVIAKRVTFKAGDVMSFDGKWWHATSYQTPVFNIFYMPGKDMESSVTMHDHRHSLPKQRNLKVGTINMAKMSKLPSNWQDLDKKEEKIN